MVSMRSAEMEDMKGTKLKAPKRDLGDFVWVKYGKTYHEARRILSYLEPVLNVDSNKVCTFVYWVLRGNCEWAPTDNVSHMFDLTESGDVGASSQKVLRRSGRTAKAAEAAPAFPKFTAKVRRCKALDLVKSNDDLSSSQPYSRHSWAKVGIRKASACRYDDLKESEDSDCESSQVSSRHARRLVKSESAKSALAATTESNRGVCRESAAPETASQHKKWKRKIFSDFQQPETGAPWSSEKKEEIRKEIGKKMPLAISLKRSRNLRDDSHTSVVPKRPSRHVATKTLPCQNQRRSDAESVLRRSGKMDASDPSNLSTPRHNIPAILLPFQQPTRSAIPDDSSVESDSTAPSTRYCTKFLHTDQQVSLMLPNGEKSDQNYRCGGESCFYAKRFGKVPRIIQFLAYDSSGRNNVYRSIYKTESEIFHLGNTLVPAAAPPPLSLQSMH